MGKGKKGRLIRRTMESWQRFLSRFKLHSRLLLSFLIVLLIPTLLISYNNYIVSTRNFSQDLKEDLTMGKNIINRNYRDEIDKIEGIARIKSSDTNVQSAIKSKNIIKIMGLFSQHFLDDNKLSYVEVLDLDGKKITGKGRISDNIPPLSQDLLDFVKDKRIVISQIDLTENGILIRGMGAITDDVLQEQTNGILVAAKLLGQNYWLSLSNDLNMEFLLFDNNGEMITSSFSETVIENPGFNSSVTEENMLWTDIEVNSNTYHLVGYPLRDHENKVIGYLGIATLKTPLINAIDTMKKTIIFYAALGVLIAILIAMFLTRSISNPISNLIGTVESIAKGNLTEKIEVIGKDEISRLSKSINGMTVNLKGLVTEVMDSSSQVAALAQELAASTEEASTITQEVTATSEKISVDTSEQSDKINVTSSIIKEMSKSIQEVAAGAQKVAQKSRMAREQMNLGQDALENLLEQIHKLSSIVQKSGKVIQQLATRSREIDNIIGLISQITEQTNLLALNAAIEAARAGEHGRGFAVVADEVRQLANQSNVAATDISSIIQEIQKDTEEAVEIMNQGTHILEEGNITTERARKTFLDVIEAVKVSSEVSGSIAAATEEQKQDSDEMVNAIEEINDISNTTANGARQISSAVQEQLRAIESISVSSQQLASMAGELNILIEKFKIN